MRLDVKDLCFSYGDKQVLRGIDLSLDRPGLYCIIGPNGVGKSTLVKCLNRLLTPSSGRVELDGKDVTEMSFGEVSRVIYPGEIRGWLLDDSFRSCPSR